MLPDNLKDKYEVTGKVTSAKFRNATLGLIDLGKISEPMAKKLVKTGHLVAIGEKEGDKESSSKKDKKSPGLE